ncbi:chalcone synthase 1A [Setaria viridis]
MDIVDGPRVYQHKRAMGTASTLAIGTANPSNVMLQSDFPDFYFRVTNSDHIKEELKDGFRRICQKSAIRKRHLYIDEALLGANPEMTTYGGPSLDKRKDIISAKIPELGAAAAAAALKEWGRPVEDITHLIVGCNSGGSDQPGADYQVARLLGLSLSASRLGVYHQGCVVGASTLRLAKDLAENNAGARVLAVLVEVSIIAFRGADGLATQAFIADGASAVVVGAADSAAAAGEGSERPLFEIVCSRQLTVPGTGDAMRGLIREAGLTISLVREGPSMFASNLEAALRGLLGGSVTDGDWTALFWAMHYPGGRLILDKVETALGLELVKMRASREVLAEYGNMGSASVWFTLDGMRRWSAANGCGTAGEGCHWCVLCGFGSGLTLDLVLLRAARLAALIHANHYTKLHQSTTR